MFRPEPASDEKIGSGRRYGACSPLKELSSGLTRPEERAQVFVGLPVQDGEEAQKKQEHSKPENSFFSKDAVCPVGDERKIRGRERHDN